MCQMYLWPRRCVQLLAKEHLYKLVCGGAKGTKRKPDKSVEEPAPAEDAAEPTAKAKAKSKAKGKKPKKSE